MQERFAAAVGCQQGGGEKAAKGAHCEDETPPAGLHAWRHELGDAQGGEGVDFDDGGYFFGRGLGEGDGDRVGGADVVDQD